MQKDGALTLFFFRFWWTILLLVFCYGLYLHGVHKKKKLLNELQGKARLLQTQLTSAISEREELLLQIDSQSDPAWIERLLKKHLGMVPYGQTKVYFEKE